VSCHGWRHERLLATLPADVVQRLTCVSLVPFSSRPGVPASAEA
jgi:hypothetical protein